MAMKLMGLPKYSPATGSAHDELNQKEETVITESAALTFGNKNNLHYQVAGRLQHCGRPLGLFGQRWEQRRAAAVEFLAATSSQTERQRQSHPASEFHK